MPVAYDTDLVADVVLDAGVLTVEDGLLGVSRGGIRVVITEEWQNLAFDGKRAPVVGLDRCLASVATISLRMIQVSVAMLEIILEHGGIAGMASLTEAEMAALTEAELATYSAFATGVPMKSSQLMEVGQYAKDLTVTYARGDGGSVAVPFPFAKVTDKKFAGGDKDAAEWDLTFEARQDLTSSSNTDVVPWGVLLTAG
jgi:hypothetical protein